MKPTSFLVPAVLLTFGIAIPGCNDSDPVLSQADPARLSVYLTDAPGDVERAWIEVLEVSFRIDGESLAYSPEMSSLIEVTELIDDTHLLVEEQELDPGNLTELRLVIGDAVLESRYGEVYVLGDPDLPDGLVATGSLQCPSCQQSGFKIKVASGQLEVDEGVSLLLLDFDVTQTFGHPAGNSGQWIMHPVVHATLVPDEDGDATALDDIHAATEEIRGSVSLASEVPGIPNCPAGAERTIQDFVPLATAQTLVDGDGEPIVKAGMVEPDGTFVIAGLEDDTYTLGYHVDFDYGTDVLGFEATVTPDEVTVSGGGMDGIVFVISGATCTSK
jgi:hypothetical protein